MKMNYWLIAGGALSAIASLLHLAIIAGGPSWYRFFHAGERMALLAEQGAPQAWLTTVFIASVLAIWSAYAFSGAGLIGRLPLLKTGLVAIAAIYLLRGLMIFPLLAFRPAQADSFMIWSSAIVFGYGLAYAIGTRKAWPQL